MSSRLPVRLNGGFLPQESVKPKKKCNNLSSQGLNIVVEREYAKPGKPYFGEPISKGLLREI